MLPGTCRYQDRWKWFLPASRSFPNPPGTHGKAKNLSFRIRIFEEQSANKNPYWPYKSFFGGPPRGDGPVAVYRSSQEAIFHPGTKRASDEKREEGADDWPLEGNRALFGEGSGWSPPPMGFYLGILIKWPPPWGGTQDTDFNKGFTKRNMTKNLRRRNGGVRSQKINNFSSCFHLLSSVFVSSFFVL